MSSASIPSGTKCLICDSPTTHKCGSCQSLPYCRKDCRNKDPALYEALCENPDAILEMKLARTASILHEAFHTFREHTWAGTLLEVAIQDSNLVLRQDSERVYENWFTEFPHHLVASGEDTKRALLSLDKCKQSYVCIHTLITKLLQGLDIHIELYDVELGKVPRTVVTNCTNGEVSSNWPGARHCILRLESCKTLRAWVIDLTGAQYGITEAMYTWPNYEAAFVKQKVGIFPLSFNNAVIGEYAAIEGIPTLTVGLMVKAGRALQDAVNTWDRDQQSISGLLALQDAGYDLQKRHLLDSLDIAVQSFIATTDFRPAVYAAQLYERSYHGVSRARLNAVIPRLCREFFKP